MVGEDSFSAEKRSAWCTKQNFYLRKEMIDLPLYDKKEAACVYLTFHVACQFHIHPIPHQVGFQRAFLWGQPLWWAGADQNGNEVWSGVKGGAGGGRGEGGERGEGECVDSVMRGIWKREGSGSLIYCGWRFSSFTNCFALLLHKWVRCQLVSLCVCERESDNHQQARFGTAMGASRHIQGTDSLPSSQPAKEDREILALPNCSSLAVNFEQWLQL